MFPNSAASNIHSIALCCQRSGLTNSLAPRYSDTKEETGFQVTGVYSATGSKSSL